MVSKELLQELGLILSEELGQSLKPEQVFEVGNALVGYFETLAKANNYEYENSRNSNN